MGYTAKDKGKVSPLHFHVAGGEIISRETGIFLTGWPGYGAVPPV